jgi:hypothetical protein
MTIAHTHTQSYKKTVVYDPMKSDTFRAVQENLYINDKIQEVTAPVQPRVFMPNRLVPGKVIMSTRPTCSSCEINIFNVF